MNPSNPPNHPIFTGGQPVFYFGGNYSVNIYNQYPARMAPRRTAGVSDLRTSDHVSITPSARVSVGVVNPEVPAKDVPFWINATYDPIPGGEWSTILNAPEGPASTNNRQYAHESEAGTFVTTANRSPSPPRLSPVVNPGPSKLSATVAVTEKRGQMKRGGRKPRS